MADVRGIDSPTDPDRCQSVTAIGQCRNKAMPECKYCAIHGGPKEIKMAEQRSIRLYRLGKWQARLEQQADAPMIKSLREEIGILRILMEERICKCTDTTDLLLHSQPIADLVMKIQTVVTACHKLEEKLHVVVDRQQILQFASSIIDIISGIVTDEETLTSLSDAILKAVGKVGGEDAD